MNTIDRAEVLQTFRAAAQMRAMDRGISPVEHDWNLMSVADDAGINLFQYSRDGELINNIWVCFLSVMREYLPSGSLKYLTMGRKVQTCSYRAKRWYWTGDTYRK